MKALFITLSLVAFSSCLLAQGVAINGTGAPANPAAILDLSSTSGGLLLPRMTTTQMNAISSPVSGLMVYNSTTNCMMLYTAGAWQTIYCACVTPPTTPGSITGPSSVCYGQSGIAFSIAALVGASYYTWTIPAGDTIT